MNHSQRAWGGLTLTPSLDSQAQPSPPEGKTPGGRARSRQGAVAKARWRLGSMQQKRGCARQPSVPRSADPSEGLPGPGLLPPLKTGAARYPVQQGESLRKAHLSHPTLATSLQALVPRGLASAQALKIRAKGPSSRARLLPLHPSPRCPGPASRLSAALQPSPPPRDRVKGPRGRLSRPCPTELEP